jgi:two-component sensor histidine kinase
MAVQYLGMAIYELATNSAKHGALSSRTGQLEIVWSVVPEADEKKRLRLRWQELGGPVVTPNRSRGFGRQVLEYLAPTALGGTGKLSFLPDGVVWVLEGDGALVH